MRRNYRKSQDLKSNRYGEETKNASIQIFDWVEKLWTESILNRFRCTKVVFDGFHRCTVLEGILHHYHRVNIDCKLDILHKNSASFFFFFFSASNDHGTQTFCRQTKSHALSHSDGARARARGFNLHRMQFVIDTQNDERRKELQIKDCTKERMNFTRTHILPIHDDPVHGIREPNRKPSRLFRYATHSHSMTYIRHRAIPCIQSIVTSDFCTQYRRNKRTILTKIYAILWQQIVSRWRYCEIQSNVAHSFANRRSLIVLFWALNFPELHANSIDREEVTVLN